MSLLQVVSLLGGVGLFLFGMTLMGDGLTRVSGSKLEPILYRLSGTPIRALMLGTGVTAIIQSSSATSIMAVGFVNAGMMALEQAINVILGAILGTSITGWVICLTYIEGAGGISSLLSASTLTSIVGIAGGIFRFYGKRNSSRNIGDILLGFAILMSGMHMMSGAVSDLGERPEFIGMMSSMRHPLLGIAVGAAFTAVLQSASAAVGILQALSVTGALSFEAALPLLMGINVGASVPVLLSAVGAGAKGKQTALVYLVTSILGVLVCGAGYYIAHAGFHFSWGMMVMDPFSTARVNTIFRLANLLVLAPFTKTIASIVRLMVPGEEETPQEKPIIQLEDRFLKYPTLALEHCHAVMQEMAEKTLRSVTLATGLLNHWSSKDFEEVITMEEEIDLYEDKIASWLLRMNSQKLKPEQSDRSHRFLRTLTDFERISDHARNIAESAQELQEKNLFMSEAATEDLAVLIDQVKENVEKAFTAFLTEDEELAEEVDPQEEVVELLCDELKMRQVDRLRHRQGNIIQNWVFNDLLTDLERISDHCLNIATAIMRHAG